MSSRFQRLTKEGDSMVVEAYGALDMCSSSRIDAQLTRRLLKMFRTAVSTVCFLESNDSVEGKTVSTRSKNSARSGLFSGGSTVLVCLTTNALPSISCRSTSKSPTTCIAWPAMAALNLELQLCASFTDRQKKVVVASRVASRLCRGMEVGRGSSRA